jgi:AraC-like DNA-binding protein
MNVLPNSLLTQDNVKVLYQDRDLVFLEKKVSESILEKPSYMSMYSLSMVQDGAQHISCQSGEKVELEAGMTGLIPKGIYSVTDLFTSGKPFQARIIFFSDRLLRKLRSTFKVKAEKVDTDPRFIIAVSPHYQDIFWNSILELSALNTVNAAALFEAKFKELMFVLQEAIPNLESWIASTDQEPISRDINDLMEAHFDKPMQVSDFAFLSGKSESAFKGEFKLKYGESPKKWIIKRRMDKAKGLLNGKNAVSEVAKLVGYENISLFNEAFNNEFGIGPEKYLQQLI